MKIARHTQASTSARKCSRRRNLGNRGKAHRNTAPVYLTSNGKVGATPDMAARVERAFGIPAQTLLDMQAALDAKASLNKGTPETARTYVPPFLAIKANDIEAWASHNISARSRVAVLLRTLVHSTGAGLTKVDFPGNDDAERPGWDGYCEAENGTPWVPKGATGWEFGVTENIKQKADGDSAKSVKAQPKKNGT